MIIKCGESRLGYLARYHKGTKIYVVFNKKVPIPFRVLSYRINSLRTYSRIKTGILSDDEDK